MSLEMFSRFYKILTVRRDLPVIVRSNSKLIFLHGRGDTGTAWCNELRNIQPSGMNTICPTAPRQSIGVDKTTAWFKSRRDEQSILSATSDIHDLIERTKSEGIAEQKIVLGGFSEGGALALFSAITFKGDLGGVIVLSGWLPIHTKFLQLRNCHSDLPIFLGHGDSDEIVTLAYAENTYEVLKTFMNNTTFKIYKGLDHSTSTEEMMDVTEFLSKFKE